jgi:hypothetical protein
VTRDHDRDDHRRCRVSPPRNEGTCFTGSTGDRGYPVERARFFACAHLTHGQSTRRVRRPPCSRRWTPLSDRYSAHGARARGRRRGRARYARRLWRPRPRPGDMWRPSEGARARLRRPRGAQFEASLPAPGRFQVSRTNAKMPYLTRRSRGRRGMTPLCETA